MERLAFADSQKIRLRGSLTQKSEMEERGNKGEVINVVK